MLLQFPEKVKVVFRKSIKKTPASCRPQGSQASPLGLSCTRWGWFEARHAGGIGNVLLQEDNSDSLSFLCLKASQTAVKFWYS